MKRIIMAGLLLVLASSFSVALSQSKKTMGNKAGLEKTVHSFFEFVKANNLAKMKSHYTADYTFTGPDGKIMGAEERLKVLQAPGNTFVSASDITVRTYGSSGVATGIATTKDTTGATVQSRFIQAWTWQSGRWRLAASQVTKIE